MKNDVKEIKQEASKFAILKDNRVLYITENYQDAYIDQIAIDITKYDNIQVGDIYNPMIKTFINPSVKS